MLIMGWAGSINVAASCCALAVACSPKLLYPINHRRVEFVITIHRGLNLGICNLSRPEFAWSMAAECIWLYDYPFIFSAEVFALSLTLEAMVATIEAGRRGGCRIGVLTNPPEWCHPIPIPPAHYSRSLRDLQSDAEHLPGISMVRGVECVEHY